MEWLYELNNALSREQYPNVDDPIDKELDFILRMKPSNVETGAYGVVISYQINDEPLPYVIKIVRVENFNALQEIYPISRWHANQCDRLVPTIKFMNAWVIHNKHEAINTFLDYCSKHRSKYPAISHSGCPSPFQSLNEMKNPWFLAIKMERVVPFQSWWKDTIETTKVNWMTINTRSCRIKTNPDSLPPRFLFEYLQMERVSYQSLRAKSINDNRIQNFGLVYDQNECTYQMGPYYFKFPAGLSYRRIDWGNLFTYAENKRDTVRPLTFEYIYNVGKLVIENAQKYAEHAKNTLKWWYFNVGEHPWIIELFHYIEFNSKTVIHELPDVLAKYFKEFRINPNEPIIEE